MRHVDFEQVEAGFVRQHAWRRRNRRRPARMSSRVISRGTGLRSGKYGMRRRRHQRPPAFAERLVVAFPEALRRALAARVSELNPDLRRALPVHEVDDALPRRACARARRGRRTRARCGRRGQTSVISAMTSPAPPMARLPRCTRCQSPTVPSSATYWHIGDMTMRFGITRSRSRNGVNMGGGTPRRSPASTAVCASLARDRPRSATAPIHARQELRIAHPQVLVRDAQRTREQRERELQRRLAHVALGVLEPCERRLRGALQALDLRPPRLPRTRAAPRQSPRAARLPCGIEFASERRAQRDGVLHRHPRARARPRSARCAPHRR